MSLSSSSSSDSNNLRSVLSQVITSTPQGVPNADKLTDNQVKQVQQTRQNRDDLNMESDSAIAGAAGKDRASSVSQMEGQEVIEQQGLAAGKETASASTASLTQNASTGAASQKRVEDTNKSLELSSLSSLSSVDASQLQEIQNIVASATRSTNETSLKNLDTPGLPKPTTTPRQDVMEISLALAKAITALGESTQAALENFQSTQTQASNMNKMSLESQGLKIDKEREEFQKLQEIQKKAGNNSTMDTVNKVMIGVTVAITVVSVVAALFTCGLGLIGTAAAGATAAAAGATAGATAAATTATSVATTVATQVTMQAVMQAVKQAIIQGVKQAIVQAIKQGLKKGIMQAIKQAIKAAVKTLTKNIGKIFNTGKNAVSKSFPNLSKVMNTLGSKWVTLGVGALTAVPQLVSGIGNLQLSDMQKDLAKIQKEVGALTAQSEMMKAFTLFWQQASKIAAKQTESPSETQQQAAKTGAQIAKALSAISGALAAAA
ncbi:secretion system protein [Chlamydia muridarum str. Nigg]|uniref:Type III secretion system membrane protein n=2 Tax=Chlamydia muridarum TaxID=83560 RepID=A0A069ZSX1_CHLMR|nr:type III secretion system membrane protein [Chlamydia muridarum]AAF39663.1 conserved hypothetical protein [Chlamydia muridarum str. Nigg]AHH23253.1 type III secretion system membrane protein [Chlamydia muridarum str. Nigg3 CMUT3-5]AHH24179.1 type III secretion system membrane protein [Chlamydia muridarum str. Nigg CM972]AID38379.1 type III secretion system membrane protein [Chlamydia muridarum str. Nigg 2 MCR]AIT91013.1 type III secretion system membrane protein [Chlamydia muridarum]